MANQTHMDWKTYESITKYIYETLGSATGVKVLGHGHTCKLTGKSGVDHQIDILTAHSDGVHSYRTAIECKYWKEKINKEIVMKIAHIIEDAGIEKGVIVARNGFTEDGAQFAKHKNIALVQLREVEESDQEITGKQFQLGTLNISLGVTIRRPEIIKTTLEYCERQDAVQQSINIYKAVIRLSEGNKKSFTEFITAFQDELHSEGKIGETITRRYELPFGSLLETKNSPVAEIKAIIFTGVLRKIDSNSNQTFALEDKVWLIMKSIFDGKSFTIFQGGLIQENKPT